MRPREISLRAANPRQRDVRTKRPVILLSECLHQCGAQRCDLLTGGAIDPHQSGPSGLRAITEMFKPERKRREQDSDGSQAFDCLLDRSFLPWRHQGEMNVAWRDPANAGVFQSGRKFRELLGKVGRDLYPDEHPRRPGFSVVHSFTLICQEPSSDSGSSRPLPRTGQTIATISDTSRQGSLRLACACALRVRHPGKTHQL